MSFPAACEPSSSSTAASPADLFLYDVFLSFRGADTRHGFVSHLYNALRQRGISTFKDDQNLDRGKPITPEILRVIQQSRFSIAVFSEGYASSPWCLGELQAIIQCTERDETRAVLPIFYNIDPSDVSEVKNSYAESFAKHELDFPRDPELLRNWRAALSKAAEFSGWGSRNRDEPTLISMIVADVLNKLGRHVSNKLSGLVGMEIPIKKVELLLHTGLVDIRIVGVWGMPGIGKTTLAEAVYHQISHKFDACCFLKCVREAAETHGLDHLRSRLLSALIVEDGFKMSEQQLDVLMSGRLLCKCVLVVLDDVSHVDQLARLAGDRDWFGAGSRIIVTTRDKHLLEQHGVDSIYEVKPLSGAESLQLFQQHAFKNSANSNRQDFSALSQRVVNYAQGLPLALKVLGSSLFNMHKGEWESKLDTLEDEPPGDVIKVLRLSLDTLSRNEKKIFLDVACFFKGEDKDYVVSILEACGFPASYGLEVLRRRSLLILQDDTNVIWMHDLVQQMGWEVVRQECFEDAGRRTRLWDHQDVQNVLTQNIGTRHVEGVTLDISKVNEMSVEVDAFHRMTSLRLLKICYLQHSGSSEYVSRNEPCPDTYDCRGNDAYFSGKLESLPHELGSLQLAGHPSSSPGRNDSSVEDYKLHFSGELRTLSNKLTSLHWHGYPFETLPPNFYPRNLVEFNLSYSRLRNCWSRKEAFDKLKFIKLSNSKELTHAPDFSFIPNLEILILEGCVKLVELHPSAGSLEKLIYLNLKGCKSLLHLPPSIAMSSLKILILSGCSQLKNFPEVEGNMESLSELLLDGTDIGEIPSSIQRLTGLVVLSVTGCKRLGSIPAAVGSCRALKILRLSGCADLRHVLFELSMLGNLEELHAQGTALDWRCLVAGGHSKLKIITLHHSRQHDVLSSEVSESSRLSKSSFGLVTYQFPSLTHLDLSYCNLRDRFWGISSLASLKVLDLSGNDFARLSRKELPKNIKVLLLANCEKLLSIPRLPPTTYSLEAPNCTLLQFMDYPAGNESGRMRGINLMNCLQLGTESRSGHGPRSYCEVAVRLLLSQIQKMSSPSVDVLSIIIPASSIIPEWSPFQDVGSSTTSFKVSGSHSWSNDGLKGLVVWASFEVRGSVARGSLSLSFRIVIDGANVISDVGFVVSENTRVDSEHMWLRFIPALLFKTMPFGGPSQLGGWAMSAAAAVEANSPDLVVKSCGLAPVRCGEDGRFSKPENLLQNGGRSNSWARPASEGPRSNIGSYKYSLVHDNVSSGSYQTATTRVLQSRNASGPIRSIDSNTKVKALPQRNLLKLASPVNNGFSDFGANAHGRPYMDKNRSNVHVGRTLNDDALGEQNRGPRTTKSKTQLAVKVYTAKVGDPNAEENIIISSDHYNRDDFQVDYTCGKFFVIKSYSEDDVHKSIKYNVWSSTPHGNKKLQSAYEDAQKIAADKASSCPIFLFFSVNASGQFCGVAEMIGPVDFRKDMDFWQQDKWSGSFPVKWHMIKDVQSGSLRHIILENNENKPVTNSRDTQEVMFMQGLEMLKIFKSQVLDTSLLDDFTYYENRQRIMQEEKTRFAVKRFGTPFLAAALDPNPKLNSRVGIPSTKYEKAAVQETQASSGTARIASISEPPTRSESSDRAVAEVDNSVVAATTLKIGSLNINPRQPQSMASPDPAGTATGSNAANVVTVGTVPVKVNEYAESSGVLTFGTIPLDSRALPCGKGVGGGGSATSAR
ncbi:unnamed protein product [Linum trigynum]|uniref:TIR domain-containing protein n=1 Tax=Linum trigynum TaxID=586398 RepID=A0AAV2GUG4_9ROSI